MPADEHAEPREHAAVLAARRAVRRSRACRRGWKRIPTSASTMNAGTIASNASAGSASSSTAPAIAPRTDAVPSRSARSRCPASSRR